MPDAIVYIPFAMVIFGCAYLLMILNTLTMRLKPIKAQILKKHPAEENFMTAHQGLEPGVYFFPQIDRIDKADDEFREKQFRGPNGTLHIAEKPLTSARVMLTQYLIQLSIFLSILGLCWLLELGADQGPTVALIAFIISGSYLILSSLDGFAWGISRLSRLLLLRAFFQTLATTGLVWLLWTIVLSIPPWIPPASP